MIRIVQCLCPARHAIVASAYDTVEAMIYGDGGAQAEAAFRALIVKALESGVIDPWCGICHARDTTWTFEDAGTRFATMDEARPELERLERENAAARAVLGRHGQN